ncbi:hypothetical protein [Pleionea mediterranea]|jgi:hypothetical protein|uniref:Uncharacterized protein n=1 Tax=Pleionea mediterranea TaxID=523701 RepID=A0A316FDC6_9GAMM|nr:hypothetical protein [Pleionea mediterranea]PWK46433.1 hypothetical protein C8D97_113118 [Pleionea mediterranea]
MTQETTRSVKLSAIPSHVKMIMESIKSFANDGLYSVDELERIITIAIEDGEIDADERRVLATVLNKAKDIPFDEEVKPYITSLRKLYL